MKYVRYIQTSLYLFFLPVVALAQPSFTGDIVQCDRCGYCDLVSLAQNIMNFLVFFAVIVGTLVIVYSGFLYLTAVGNESQLTKAKSNFTTVIFGLIVVLAAYLIIDVVVSAFLNVSFADSWDNLPGCPAT